MSKHHKRPRGVQHHHFINLPDDVRYLTHFASGNLYGAVYFIVSDSMKLVKIGASNVWRDLQLSVEERVARVIGDNPLVPFDRYTSTVPLALGSSEPEIHEHFDAYRYQDLDEWFQYTDDLKDFVESVFAMNSEFDKNAAESEAYLNHEKEMAAKGQPPTLPMPAWPTAKPWAFLQRPAKPPTQKLVGFQPIFKTG